MMRMFKSIFVSMMSLFAIGAANPVLIPDISQRQIDIVYSFTGAELLLFGAILYPGGKLPTEEADVVVTLKGPSQSIIVREKQKLAGLIWVNASSARFESAPAYYALASSKPLNTLIDERLASVYGLGFNNLHLSPSSDETPAVRQRFESGLINMRKKTMLFAESRGSVEISQGVLYRARLFIPPRVPVGTYTAETFLISKGRVLAAATRDIEIRKSGFERFVAEAAVNSPFSYGLFAVGLSLLLGWGAAALFRKI